jgi:hypothetical protein
MRASFLPEIYLKIHLSPFFFIFSCALDASACFAIGDCILREGERVLGWRLLSLARLDAKTELNHAGEGTQF